MTLLGRPLLVAVGVMALLMPAATVLLWSRVPGPRWARTAQHAGLVVTAQLTALLLGLVALNDYGQFFTSWSDLLGGGQPGQVAAREHFGGPLTHRVAHGRPLPGHAIRPWVANPAYHEHATPARWPGTPSQDGALLSMDLAGPATRLREPALVYLPPAYFTRHLRKMPLVEVFSGYPGETTGLMSRLHYPQTLLAEMRNHTARPMALVMLRPSPVYPWDTECTNVYHHGPRAFDYLAADVPNVISGSFGLRLTDVGSIGDSTGGMCAVKLAVVDPHRFHAAVSLSGYFHAVQDFTTGNIYGSRGNRELNDIIWRLRHLPPPPVSVLVNTALDESGQDGYQSAQAFLHAVRPPMSADEVVLSHGGHNFDTWLAEIPHSLQWLSHHLR